MNRPLRALLALLLLSGLGPRMFAQAESSVAPEAKKTVSPEHPAALVEQKVEGEAQIECLVGSDGKVGEVKVLSASRPEFGEAAAVAVRQWEFKPGRKDGKAIAMRVTIPFTFQLPGDHPLEQFARRKVFIDVEGEVVPAENLPKWPMPKQLLAPSYPEALRGSGKRGKAVVSVVIDRQGRVVNPKLVKATWPEFEMPALAAAVSLEFAPQLAADKKSVNVSMDLQFDFRDEGRPAKKAPAEGKARGDAAPKEKKS
jgi:TonB family protein